MQNVCSISVCQGSRAQTHTYWQLRSKTSWQHEILEAEPVVLLLHNITATCHDTWPSADQPYITCVTADILELSNVNKLQSGCWLAFAFM